MVKKETWQEPTVYGMLDIINCIYNMNVLTRNWTWNWNCIFVALWRACEPAQIRMPISNSFGFDLIFLCMSRVWNTAEWRSKTFHFQIAVSVLLHWTTSILLEPFCLGGVFICLKTDTDTRGSICFANVGTQQWWRVSFRAWTNCHGGNGHCPSRVSCEDMQSNDNTSWQAHSWHTHTHKHTGLRTYVSTWVTWVTK